MSYSIIDPIEWWFSLIVTAPSLALETPKSQRHANDKRGYVYMPLEPRNSRVYAAKEQIQTNTEGLNPRPKCTGEIEIHHPTPLRVPLYFASRSKLRRWLQSLRMVILSSYSPSLDSQYHNLIRHDKGGKPHADCEYKHSHQTMLFHDVDHIFGASHEYQPTGDETECHDEFAWWARWVEGCWRRDKEEDVGYSSS